VFGNILVGDNSPHPRPRLRFADINAFYPSIGDPAAEDFCMQHVSLMEIIDEFGLAAYFGDSVDSAKTLSHALHLVLPFANAKKHDHPTPRLNPPAGFQLITY
jgi:hypothetical protein